MNQVTSISYHNVCNDNHVCFLTKLWGCIDKHKNSDNWQIELTFSNWRLSVRNLHIDTVELTFTFNKTIHLQLVDLMLLSDRDPSFTMSSLLHLGVKSLSGLCVTTLALVV